MKEEKKNEITKNKEIGRNTEERRKDGKGGYDQKKD